MSICCDKNTIRDIGSTIYQQTGSAGCLYSGHPVVIIFSCPGRSQEVEVWMFWWRYLKQAAWSSVAKGRSVHLIESSSTNPPWTLTDQQNNNVLISESKNKADLSLGRVLTKSLIEFARDHIENFNVEQGRNEWTIARISPIPKVDSISTIWNDWKITLSTLMSAF